MRAIGSRANSLFETTPGAHHIENILADDIAASCNLKQRGDLMHPVHASIYTSASTICPTCLHDGLRASCLPSTLFLPAAVSVRRRI
jgi:hypothetical protein